MPIWWKKYWRNRNKMSLPEIINVVSLVYKDMQMGSMNRVTTTNKTSVTRYGKHPYALPGLLDWMTAEQAFQIAESYFTEPEHVHWLELT